MFRPPFPPFLIFVCFRHDGTRQPNAALNTQTVAAHWLTGRSEICARTPGLCREKKKKARILGDTPARRGLARFVLGLQVVTKAVPSFLRSAAGPQGPPWVVYTRESADSACSGRGQPFVGPASGVASSFVFTCLRCSPHVLRRATAGRSLHSDLRC